MRYVELDDGMKFLVLTELDYEKNHYLYVASVTEDVKYFFLWQKDADTIEFVEDGRLILDMLNIVVEDLKRFTNKVQN